MKSKYIFTPFFLATLLLFSCEKENFQIYSTGTFEATEILVSAQSAGQIMEMPVEEGQNIKKDQLIARLDVEKMQLQKQQLEAGLEELNLNASLAKENVKKAQIQYDNLKTRSDRFEKLLAEKSVSQQQMDDLNTQLELAEKQLKSAHIQAQTIDAKGRQLNAQLGLVERQIADGEVRSPLNGIIIQKLKEPGELAMPGVALVQIANLEQMEITIYISEIDLAQIKLEEELSIQIDSYPDRKFSGKITWISPKAEFTPKNVQTKEARTNLVYAVKLTVENTEQIFKIGMPADVFRK